MDTQATSRTSLVGGTIGGYRLVTELGSGGMGTVYYGEHIVIGRRAAIKVLHPEVAKDHTIVSRFLTEARSVNDIRHPNVVEITDLGRHGELYYIVMSFLEGETVGERLERMPVIDEATTLRIGRQIASALSAAHERGIVHRDLKPENIFVTAHPDYPDHVKVLDFGIAKLMRSDAKVEHHTQAGMLIGTPAYMSPEQCRGQVEIDHRTDIYSLAVMLYEMLTGQQPFTGESLGDIIVGHITRTPTPPIDVNPKISPHVNEAIMRALQKDPARRFPNMREMRDALEDTPPSARVAIDPEKKERDAREAQSVVDKLTSIIMQRIAKDRLVVPSMPVIAIECMNALRDPNQSFKKIASIIGKDPLLASRLLRVANSAAFPSMVPATTLEQAISRMGVDGVMIAVVKFSMHQAFVSRDEKIQAAFRGIWQHSLATALVAKDLTQRLGPGAPDPNAAYLGGLLHDIGKPVVASLLLEAEKMMTGEDKKWMNEAVWKKVVDGSHRKVGMALARKWGLPDDLTRAIEQSREYEHHIPRSTANVVRLANALTKKHGLYMGDIDQAEVERAVLAGKLLLKANDDMLIETCKGLYSKVATLVDGGNQPKPRTTRAPGANLKA